MTAMGLAVSVFVELLAFGPATIEHALRQCHSIKRTGEKSGEQSQDPFSSRAFLWLRFPLPEPLNVVSKSVRKPPNHHGTPP